MSNENEKTEEGQKESSGTGDERVTDAKTSAEEYAGDNECPECGEPVIEVRANCPKCGYEYQDSDYSDKEAGSEFISGSAVDDEGNEIPDDDTGGGGGQEPGDDQGSEGKKEDSDDDKGSSESD